MRRPWPPSRVLASGSRIMPPLLSPSPARTSTPTPPPPCTFANRAGRPCPPHAPGNRARRVAAVLVHRAQGKYLSRAGGGARGAKRSEKGPRRLVSRAKCFRQSTHRNRAASERAPPGAACSARRSPAPGSDGGEGGQRATRDCARGRRRSRRIVVVRRRRARGPNGAACKYRRDQPCARHARTRPRGQANIQVQAD